MATYYVDFVNGLDANNGLGPDASAVTNKPWKTITKLLGAAGMSSGDTAYLSPAGPFREVVSVAMTSATVETKIIGDWSNSRGFKTSGGVVVAPGIVSLTGYTTNDKTAPTTSTLFVPNSRDFLTFEDVVFIGGNGNPHILSAQGTDATNYIFRRCAFYCGYLNQNVGTLSLGPSTAIAMHWLFDSCHFFMRNTFNIVLPTSASADYDCDIELRNCFLTAMALIVDVNSSGAQAFKGGGVFLNGCTLYTASNPAFRVVSANISTSIPCKVENSIILSPTTALNANTSGQIVESNNFLTGSAPRVNVSAGTGSISDGSYAALLNMGEEMQYGMTPRHFMSPAKGSPLLGFGGSASVPATDIFGLRRPAGGVSASTTVGMAERHNTFTKETGTVRTGTNAISIVGPGDQQFLIPVDASATSIRVYVQWDATYAGTKPQFQIDANASIGVTTETVTAVGSSGSWELLTLSTITPSAAGVVVVRVVANDTNGAGVTYVDDFAIA